jgi:hypothetical protein
LFAARHLSTPAAFARAQRPALSPAHGARHGLAGAFAVSAASRTFLSGWHVPSCRLDIALGREVVRRNPDSNEVTKALNRKVRKGTRKVRKGSCTHEVVSAEVIPANFAISWRILRFKALPQTATGLLARRLMNTEAGCLTK